jgi:hypothetical protein
MHKYSEDDIKEMLGFLIDNIFIVFGNQIFQKTVGIPMGTNYAPLLAGYFYIDLFKKNKFLAVAFNSTFRHIDNVLSINNNQFHSHVDSILYTPVNLKLKTPQNHLLLLLDVLLNIDDGGKLTTHLYDKRYDFNFAIVNFPYIICSKIPLSPAYGVYISQ